jgi:CheY-like chemotaxis protein
MGANVPDESMTGKRILVVDDDEGVVAILADMLIADGHEVDTASNGLQALNRLERRRYDAIVCDLRMPELDGQGLYRELERWRPELLRRIVFVTGSAGDPANESFLKETRAPIIIKPFRMEDIQRTVREVLRTT